MTTPDSYSERFGPWQVTAVLSEGGMGRIFVAQNGQGQQAVIKTIRPELASRPAYRARFRSEAQAALRVRSNFAARIYDCDPDGDPPWMAMEKIDGHTLAERIHSAGPLPPAAVVAFAADLAEAVHAFYDHGLAHGDLTPTNIVLQADNRLKILDLGLARPSADEAHTTEDPVLGTPYWIAPEVAAGFAPTTSSDINQWAKLVLCAASGYPLIATGEAAHDPLAAIPDQLRHPVEQCLAPIPDRRLPPDQLWAQTRLRQPGMRVAPARPD